MKKEFALSTSRISEASGQKRKVPPKVKIVSDAFWDGFDQDTLFYDFIDLGDGNFSLITPPLYNLEGYLTNILQRGAPSARLRIRHFRSYDVIDLKVPAKEDTALRSLINVEFGIVPSTIDASLFAGKRVLYTQNKNNKLEWITDWMKFHHEQHGANALLLFDNASTLYSLDELRNAVANIKGFDQTLVVSSDHRYMPAKDSCTNALDCLFLQSALMKVARLRWLSDAASVLSCDIDELVVHPGGKSIFDATEKNLLGCEAFSGAWTYPKVSDTVPTHRSHVYIKATDMISRSKYCYRPKSFMGRGELHVHTIHGTMRNQILTKLKKLSEFTFLHCTAISTYRRDRVDTSRPEFVINKLFERILG